MWNHKTIMWPTYYQSPLMTPNYIWYVRLGCLYTQENYFVWKLNYKIPQLCLFICIKLQYKYNVWNMLFLLKLLKSMWNIDILVWGQPNRTNQCSQPLETSDHIRHTYLSAPFQQMSRLHNWLVTKATFKRRRKLLLAYLLITSILNMNTTVIFEGSTERALNVE